jgi:hypothetical protein
MPGVSRKVETEDMTGSAGQTFLWTSPTRELDFRVSAGDIGLAAGGDADDGSLQCLEYRLRKALHRFLTLFTNCIEGAVGTQ